MSFYAFLDIQHSELHRDHDDPETLRSFSPITYLPTSGREMAPMFIARAGLDAIPGINDSIDRFLEVALSRNAPVTLVNHALGVHGFDSQTDDARSREIIESALDFMKTHLEIGDHHDSSHDRPVSSGHA